MGGREEWGDLKINQMYNRAIKLVNQDNNTLIALIPYKTIDALVLVLLLILLGRRRRRRHRGKAFKVEKQTRKLNGTNKRRIGKSRTFLNPQHLVYSSSYSSTTFPL